MFRCDLGAVFCGRRKQQQVAWRSWWTWRPCVWQGRGGGLKAACHKTERFKGCWTTCRSAEGWRTLTSTKLWARAGEGYRWTTTSTQRRPSDGGRAGQGYTTTVALVFNHAPELCRAGCEKSEKTGLPVVNNTQLCVVRRSSRDRVECEKQRAGRPAVLGIVPCSVPVS